MRKLLIIIFILFINFTSASNYPKDSIAIDTNQMNIKEIVESESGVKIPRYANIKYIEYIYNTANDLELPIRIVFRLIYTESKFKGNTVSHEGAKGFMQLMPRTYSKYGKLLEINNLNIDNNCKNIIVGLYYLKSMYNYWNKRNITENNKWKFTLASYNAGINNVIKHKGIPPFKATRNFLAFILKEPSIYLALKNED